ncbi:MAG: ribbon-helix-helix protein, CopG family [Promethearchaeota archaeon]|nr:MAG: ribbon-helix-helix protein, CopG family [Candidatus Lokiarchaeota archaeon]
MPKEEKKKRKMVNITINIPNIYDTNIQKLIEMKLLSNRSEAIRIALREYLQKESENLLLLGYQDKKLPVKTKT